VSDVETAVGAFSLHTRLETSRRMPNTVDRFLRHSTGISRKGAALGRIFNVTRETWRLSDDPKVARPATELLLTRRTASDAADLAREAAQTYPRHGFHKPSGAWWGADEALFHRFVVHAGQRRAAGAVLLLSGLAGLLALGVARHRSRPAGGGEKAPHDRRRYPRPRPKSDRSGA
jgi:hypothetical protein